MINFKVFIAIYLTISGTIYLCGFWSSNNDEKKTPEKEENSHVSEPVVKTNDEPIIGIDLGTSYSRVAIFQSSRVTIIENEQGSRMTPSYVSFTSNGERLIGDAAKNLLTSNPNNTIFQVKRLIGRTYRDPTLQQVLKYFPFTIFNEDNKLLIKVMTGFGDRFFTPEEITAMILGKMRDIAETFLGRKVRMAVISVPAYFNSVQRQATRDAGTIAGLDIVTIINEPTAAIIAYNFLHPNKEEEETILIYDLGAGKLDVSVIVTQYGIIEVSATYGDTHSGGENFDLRVMEYLIELFKSKTGHNVRGDQRAIQKLRREVERAKRILSFELETMIDIESLYHHEDFRVKLTRTTFEALNMDLFRLTLKSVENALNDADTKKSDITEIILVGGSTKIPMIRKIIKEYFNGKEPYYDINPDEAIAYGAALKGGIVSGQGDTGNEAVLDVYPLTLGIQTEGGVMKKIIPRNTMIPAKRSQTFTTSTDYQLSVNVQVFEGEQEMTEDNYFLGQFELTNITPAAKGVPSLEIIFEIDQHGILWVTGRDTATDNRKRIIFNSNKNNLSSKDIEQMIKDAEKFAEHDKKSRERIDARNNLESYVYWVRNKLISKENLVEKLPLQDKTTLENMVDEEIKWLDLNSNADISELGMRLKNLHDIATPIIDKLQVESNDSKASALPDQVAKDL